MKKEKHLTQEQRHTIFVLLKQGYNQSFIARTIGENRSVVSREINNSVRIELWEEPFTHISATGSNTARNLL